MNLNNFDLNLLISLDALLTHRNVTGAGRQVHLSQPAMSGALARLRQHFNDELLVGVGHGSPMRMTPLAQGLVGPVREILMRVQSTVSTESKFDPVTSMRRFSIACAEFVITTLVAEVVRQASLLAPSITFRLFPHTYYSGDRLDSGEIDFAIFPIAFARGDCDPSHLREDLYRETLSCVAWQENQLIGEELTMEQLNDLEQVIVRYDTRFYGWPGSVDPVSAFVVSSPDSACKLVVGTNRVAMVPTTVARLYANLMALKIIPILHAFPPFTEALHWHSRNDRDPGHRWFRSLLEDEATRVRTQRAAILGESAPSNGA